MGTGMGVASVEVEGEVASVEVGMVEIGVDFGEDSIETEKTHQPTERPGTSSSSISNFTHQTLMFYRSFLDRLYSVADLLTERPEPKPPDPPPKFVRPKVGRTAQFLPSLAPQPGPRSGHSNTSSSEEGESCSWACRIFYNAHYGDILILRYILFCLSVSEVKTGP